MTRSLLALLCAAALVPPAEAGPPEPGPPGRPCSYYALQDPGPNAPDDRLTGVVRGGPLAGDGTLICTLFIRYTGGPDEVRWEVEAPSVHGVAVLAEPITFDEDVDEYADLCTSWREPDGSMLYWHDPGRQADPVDDPGHWSAAPPALCTDRNLGPAPPAWLLDRIDQASAVPCAAFVALHSGPYDPQHAYRVYVDDDGDVYVDDDGDGLVQDDEIWWDCPPYHSGYHAWPDPADPLA